MVIKKVLKISKNSNLTVKQLKKKYLSYWTFIEESVYQHLMMFKHPEKCTFVRDKKPKWTKLTFNVHPLLMKAIAYNAAFFATQEYHERVGVNKRNVISKKERAKNEIS